ncbi:MAG: GspE/PulE/PilB domain-containing protein [Planctomycetota bacterium]|jgi:hypothetical protein
MECRIGALLVESGILNQAQLDEILRRQRRTSEPLGLLAEKMYNVDPDAVEETWVRQYTLLTRTVDPTIEIFEPRALELVTRRQAWQFRVLPIRFDDEELMVATTASHLRRALRFTTRVIGVPTYLVLADADRLGQALCRQFALPGMTSACVDDGCLDHLLDRFKPAA